MGRYLWTPIGARNAQHRQLEFSCRIVQDDGAYALHSCSTQIGGFYMHCRRAVIFLRVWIAYISFVTSGSAADLASCARQYGELTVNHWLTVSSLHQIERLLYYQEELAKQTAVAVRYREQQDAVEKTQLALDLAASTYASLFKAESKDGVQTLNDALGNTALTVSRNEQQVDRLLLDAGQKLAGPSFRASPINTELVKPTWDMRTLVDEKFRPRRILFGSTGRVGDNRILPLQFDFGSGLYSFIVPMSGRDKLSVAESTARQTDDVHKWMQQNKMGYHYWAGVYNNQNTYVADWFVKEYGKNDDVWMKLVDGKVLRSGVGANWGQPNIWNPKVRDYIQNYCATQSQYFHDDPCLVCYDYAGEPHPYGMNPEAGQPQYSGYNDSAIAAFREFLKRKFKSIDTLNRV